MYQFILIAGLPGCGKTTLAQQLDKEFILFDDLSIILINQKTTLKEFFQQLIKNKNSKVIITDPNLVIPGNQEFLINEISQNFKSFNLEFIFSSLTLLFSKLISSLVSFLPNDSH